MFKLATRPESPFWCWTSYIAGKRVRGTTSVRVKGQHKEEAEREAAAAWLAECARRGAKPDGEDFETDTLKLIEMFSDTCLPGMAKKRNPRYSDQLETDLLKYVKARFTLIDQLTPNAWAEWMSECHTRQVKPIKLRTIQRITSSANVFLDFCLRIGVIKTKPTLPYPSAEEVAPETAERRALTAEERDAFLAAMKDLDQRAWRIYTVLLYTGLRKSGLERMQKRWINFKTGFVKFPAAALKDKRPREFYLRREVLDVIEEQLAENRKSRGKDPEPLNEVVFGPFDYDGHNGKKKCGLFWSAVRKAGISDMTGLTAHHVTRHTACTLAGLQGAPLADLMAMGGWSSPQMAMRYMHTDANAARRAVERL